MYRVPRIEAGFAAIRRTLDQMIILVAALALLAFAAASADAGERRNGGHAQSSHHQQMRSHKARPVQHVSGRNTTYTKYHKAHANGPRQPSGRDYASPRNSGVMLASGGRSYGDAHGYTRLHRQENRQAYRFNQSVRHSNNHGWRHHGGGYSGSALVISVDNANADSPENYTGNEPQVIGECGANSYCTVRLGPYNNSPKIITLNASGKAIAKDAGLSDQPLLEEPVDADEAELKRRYGAK